MDTKGLLIEKWAKMIDEGETYHFMVHRNEREKKIARELPPGRKLCVNIIDRGHRNGPEAFVLLDNGVIQVYNARTRKHITDLIARPQQIISRMGKEFEKLPEATKRKVLEIARKNNELGRNEW